MKTFLKSAISPLTGKILLLNLLAPLLLIVWFLFLDKYQVYLYQSEIKRVQSLSEILASDLSDNAITKRYTSLSLKQIKHQTSSIPFEIKKPQAEQILTRFMLFADFHIKIFNLDNGLVIDSDNIKKIKKNHQKSPPKTFLNISNPLIKGEYNPETDSKKEIEKLIKTGKQIASIYSQANGINIIIISKPIYENGQLAGILQIDMPIPELQVQIFDIQKAFLQIFLITLLITIFLSLYLSRSISVPLIKLSKAADSIAKDKNRETKIPIFNKLKNEIGDLSVSINVMTQTLWNLLDETEHFASDVAHELKNPLSSVLSAVDTIENIKDQEKKDKLLSIIKSDIKRLNLLITDISSLSKIEGELQRSKSEKVNIYEVLQGFVISHGLKKQKKDKITNIEFILSGNKNIKEAQIYGDESRIAQVFENILSNAESFTPNNSVIKIELNISKSRLKITIDDEGEGIPSGKEKQIFERFYSERGKTESFGKHSGLGLAISKKIIESLGGEIFAKNKLDKNKKIIGARFVIILDKKQT